MEHTVIVRQLAPGLWHFNEPWYENKTHFGRPVTVGTPHVEAYLIAGTEKAVLIDALEDWHTPALPELIREITDLPVEVYFTHGHGDHVGAEAGNLLTAGFPMHLDLQDMDLMYEMADYFFGCVPDWMKPENFIDLKAGTTIDLGGTVLETYAVPGHTKGCICFLDRTHHVCFTGDAFGTIITGLNTLRCATLEDFLANVEAFEKWVDDDSCVLYNGHLGNVGGRFWTLAELREHRLNFPKEIENMFR